MTLTYFVMRGFFAAGFARGVRNDSSLDSGGHICRLAISLWSRLVAGVVILIVIARRRSAGTIEDCAEQFRLLHRF